MTGSLFCAFCAAATLICAAGWYTEHRLRVAILQRYLEAADLGAEAARTIVQLTEALEAKRGRAATLPPRARLYVN